MEIRFTESVIVAMEAVLQLEKGTLLVPGCRPVWCNFRFFNKVKASPIQQTERVEPTQEKRGSWKLKRTVEFFHYGSCVAIVNLIGQKVDGDRRGLDNGSFWAATRIGYYRSFSGGLSDPPKEWREIKLEHGRLVAYVVA